MAKKERKTPTIIGDAPISTVEHWMAKAVIFDFDGTLTKPRSTRTTWEAIWESVGYNANDCGLLANRFLKGDITHSQWCQLTLEKFKLKHLSRDGVISVAAGIELLPDFDECMKEIQRLGVPMYIVSGSIWDVITNVLGDSAEYFRRIEANNFGYKPDNTLGAITGTKFDFEGKGDFVKEIAKELNVSPSDILFVGNDINDEHVKAAGARTLLVNPQLTSPSKQSAWDQYIPRMRSLLEILPYVDSAWEERHRAKILAESERARITLKDLNELRLGALSVLGKYRRFSNEDRANLVGLADRIRRPLATKSLTRENFLVYASPGSGKTFFVEELARTLAGTTKFVPIDVSRDKREVCEAKLVEVVNSKQACLCMIDEVDGRKGEDWPYDVIYKNLDLNEQERAPVVFVLIGSTGGTVTKLGEMIRSRYKGTDMVDRILASAQHCAEIPPMGVGDTVCVYASKILEAAEAEQKPIQEVEKFAVYHAVLTYRTPRQIKLLADQAVRRIPMGHTQVLYDHHFESGDNTNKTFRDQHLDVALAFGKQTCRISE
ncbi:MAG: HAD family hydrolase [Acidobacteriota bacterium]